ncbi:hypothetical protein JWG45_17005 [Leptospira sp. 201903070]|uniref:Uncharacterized protein n=1 Tax=Leptospira ainlahdjerensis TaxID=2810033 RepID=A0ABS2UEN2_9LEPT|nr:hypothetical protein [Leptospira ainlahdjerensis]MBM9578846.1 hypothetical protein [Leptospira ainlahdjerensis]
MAKETAADFPLSENSNFVSANPRVGTPKTPLQETILDFNFLLTLGKGNGITFGGKVRKEHKILYFHAVFKNIGSKNLIY